jgi:molybdate-binding protein/DNA-binding XRE family transcriptional regulator
MSSGERLDNRVKWLRQARGWTQQELAQASGLSRTGVGAIEAARLAPSVTAALALARALGTSVEELFGTPATGGIAFAWLPAAFPCRYWAAEIAGKTLLFPVEAGSDVKHDGVARHAGDFPRNSDLARQSLVLATCDPAAGLLAAEYRRLTGYRLLVFTRASREALESAGRGLVHVAGVHLAAADAKQGNAPLIAAAQPAAELSLLHVACWEEGLASQPAARLRSASGAAKGGLRWVGRSPGAGARRCQDELLGARRAPRHVAQDHRGVVEAIKGGWADVGVCLRLASEEGRLAFLPVGEEAYDLCFRRELAGDPRLAALVRTVRSAEYRQLLVELPGYRPQAHWGDIEDVARPRKLPR